jgi:hypothetical protein
MGIPFFMISGHSFLLLVEELHKGLGGGGRAWRANVDESKVSFYGME